MAKTIKIGVDTGKTLPLSFLNPLQGNLKEFSEEARKKLRQSILKHGFIYPFFVWDNPEDGQIFLIDGHGRYQALTELKDKGYVIPQLPVVFIEAVSMDDAKEKLLAVASQFGKFTEVGISDFLGSFTFVPEDMFKGIDIPFLDFGNLLKPDDGSLPPQETITVSQHDRRKIDLDDYEKFANKCPRCSHEYN